MDLENIKLLSRQYIHFLGKQGKAFHIIVGIACATLVATFNYFTPDEVICTFLYVVPISIVTWFSGRRGGKIIASVCGFLWILENAHRWKPLITVWNSLSIVGVFWVIALLVAKVKRMLDRERELSRLDPLTGVMNMRAFSELVEYEMLRLQRQSDTFSLAFIDLDNFKIINDTFGHKNGDDLLKAIVDCLTFNLRKSDIVARAGGDEFIIFLPGADMNAAQKVAQKIRLQLIDLSIKNNWPITISMGVITCTEGACNLEDLISAADKLTYEVKNSGKNGVRFENYSGKVVDASNRRAIAG